MGIFNGHTKYIEVNNNPNPSNFIVLDAIATPHGTTVLRVKYPDAKNREGIKILVYLDPLVDLINQRSLDPHFGDSKNIKYPIARFEPTNEGLKDALQYKPIVRIKS